MRRGPEDASAASALPHAPSRAPTRGRELCQSRRQAGAELPPQLGGSEVPLNISPEAVLDLGDN